MISRKQVFGKILSLFLVFCILSNIIPADAIADSSQTAANEIYIMDATASNGTLSSMGRTGFYKNCFSYYLIRDFGKSSPAGLKFHVSKAVSGVLFNGKKLNKNGDGYQIDLADGKNIITLYYSGKSLKKYTIMDYKRLNAGLPDAVTDYLCVGSQYTNTKAYGMYPEKSMWGGDSWSTPISLGTFGGYITYYYKKAITNDAGHPYGVDFIIYGNSNGGAAFAEPGSVKVSKDGVKWYDLAGSEYYEDTTVRNYTRTYTQGASNTSEWKDNKGNMGSLHYDLNKNNAQALQKNYPLAVKSGVLKRNGNFHVNGVLIGRDHLNTAFGYADVRMSGFCKNYGQAGNPYTEEESHGDGFDLSWAVDENGRPVSLDSVHYIKVITANDVVQDITGEKSTEVNAVVRTEKEKPVGITGGLSKLTIDGKSMLERKPVSITAGGRVLYYETELSDTKDKIAVEAAGEAGSIVYINHDSYQGSGSAVLSKHTDGTADIRVIAQNEEKEPVIYVIHGKNSTGDAIGKTQDDTTSDNVMDRKTDRASSGQQEQNNTSTATEAENMLSSGKELTSETQEQKDTIKVSFTLIGDSVHGKNGTHTPVTWIKTETVEAPVGATIKYVTDRELKKSGIEFESTNGTYISRMKGPGEKKWLGEFSNGINSGWMYRVNGRIADTGYAAKKLKNADKIIWFYSDDYTKEKNTVKLQSLSIKEKSEYKEALKKTGTYIYKKVPDPSIGSVGGEWAVLGLTRSGYRVKDTYYKSYVKNVIKKLKECKGNLSSTKYTEYSRLILALTAIGQDVTDVGGYNLLYKLADFNLIKQQGINGPIYALLALDCHQYQLQKRKNIPVQTTRKRLIQNIIKKQLKKGGWAFTGAKADVDTTAMAIQALAAYYNSNASVKKAVNKALTILSERQNSDAGFSSYGVDNLESSAQVITALTSLGINPASDQRFIKNHKSIMDNLLTFYSANGGFKHVRKGSTDQMATEQGYYALTAYDRLLAGRSSLYHMWDVKIKRKR